MARTAVNGAVVSIASAYAVSKTMSAITNATEAVATLEAAHGVIVNDLVEITSGWQRLDGIIVRVSAVATNDVTFDDIDTTSTNLYPAGSGAGSVREVSTWTAIGQILGDTFQSSGGEQQYLEYQYLDQDQQSRIPTSQTPVGINFTLHDDILLAGQIAVQAAMDAATPAGIRIVLKDGKKLYGNAYWALGAVPILEGNNIVRRAVTLSLVGGRLIQYAS